METPKPINALNSNYKESVYQEIHMFWSGLLDPDAPWYSNLSNASALLHEKLQVWWVGFYLIEGNDLLLGPFQGPTACIRIPKGKGVCGNAWIEKRTIVVPDVHKFPGHIACSDKSNSEIVIPLLENGEVWGVLDLDSTHFHAFDEIDARELEKFCASLTKP